VQLGNFLTSFGRRAQAFYIHWKSPLCTRPPNTFSRIYFLVHLIFAAPAAASMVGSASNTWAAAAVQPEREI